MRSHLLYIYPEIDQISHHKLLGLIIDNDFSFEARKAKSRINFLSAAVIKSGMLYLSPTWSTCSKKLLERVLRMQKRAARIILNAERITRTLTMLNELILILNWIPFFIEDI